MIIIYAKNDIAVYRGENMGSINLSCNSFTYLSDEVIHAMEEANKLNQKFRQMSFGADQKILAQSEIARNDIARMLKVNSHEILFNSGKENAEIEIINNAILFLDVKTVITSKFENEHKLNYLNMLGLKGTINSMFVETSEFGEISLKSLEEILSGINKNSLVSLSHSNHYTGMLCPVKEISKLCQTHHSFFHLDLSLTIGRYEIDFQKINPDFINFDAGLLHGPKSIGITAIKSRIINNNHINSLHSENLRQSENQNISLILGFLKAITIAVENLHENQLKISSIQKYLVNEALIKLDLNPFYPQNIKPGLYNMVSYVLEMEIFGEYLVEKLDMKGIAIQKLIYPVAHYIAKNKHFITIAIDENITEKDIDFLIKTMGDIKKQNK